MIRFLATLVTVVTIICCGEPKKGNAAPNDPVLGSCVSQYTDGSCKVSLHPAYVAPLAAIDLKSGSLLYGVQALSAGVCYGLTVAPAKWWASGVNVCMNTAKTDAGTVVFPSFVGQVANFGSVGIGGLCSDANSSTRSQLICHAVLLFGLNVPIQ